jgi:hypothetical protein
MLSCQGELEQPYEINKLRILAVKADYPQVRVDLKYNFPVFNPPEVNLSILAGDADSICKPPEFSQRLYVCLPQQYSDDSSYNLNCEGENGIALRDATLNPAQFFLDLMNRYKNMGQTNLPVNVDITKDKIKFPISIMAKVSNGFEEALAIKFVEFVNYEIDNKNPVISKVYIDDVDVTSINYRFALISGRNYKIVPLIDRKSIDKVFNEIDNKYEDEGIQFSFFAQKGKFDKVATSDKKPEVVYTTPFVEKEEHTSICIVARDFRGGVDWVYMDCIRILPEKKE